MVNPDIEVLRCTECQTLNTDQDTKTLGKCKKCGCRRLRSVEFMSNDEMTALRNTGQVSQAFFALFEVTR